MGLEASSTRRPIQAFGWMSARSPGSASLCAVVQDMSVYPRGTSSPGSVGATPADLVGGGREEGPGKRLAARGQETPSLHLFSLGHCGSGAGGGWLCGPDSCLDGPWRGRLGPQGPILAQVFCRVYAGPGKEARPSRRPTVIRSTPGPEAPGLKCGTCWNPQKAGLW